MNSVIARAATADSAASPGLAELPDHALLASTQRLVGRANQTLAALLAHLGEVEARGLHRVRACASLYTYCVYELRMSEDAAFRRARAARLCRQFPALLDCVAAGAIHLTGLLMIGPHLTDENLADVLARAKHRTKKEIAKLVRQIDPLPDVPARVEPLGPGAPGRGFVVPPAPSWSQFVASMNPVRELDPGARPADWVEDEPAVEEIAEAPAESAAPTDGTPLLPQRYAVQFTATAEYVQLLEEARDLLAHAVPDRSIEEVHLRAMRALVAELRKKKYARTDKPRATPPDPQPQPEPQPEPQRDPRRRGSTRTIPAAVRRAVGERDGGRCTYVDASGQRCRETARLELHHEQPFARGGPATASNIALRCRAHNGLAAEGDFGRDFMDRKKGARAAPSDGSA